MSYLQIFEEVTLRRKMGFFHSQWPYNKAMLLVSLQWFEHRVVKRVYSNLTSIYRKLWCRTTVMILVCKRKSCVEGLKGYPSDNMLRMCWFLLRKASVLSSSRNDCWCVCLVLSKYECIEHVWWNNCTGYQNKTKNRKASSTNIDAFKKRRKEEEIVWNNQLNFHFSQSA